MPLCTTNHTVSDGLKREAVLFPELDNKQRQPLSKTFGVFRLQNVHGAFLVATFVTFSNPRLSPLVTFLGVLGKTPFDVLCRT